jgi:hypothetical protein
MPRKLHTVPKPEVLLQGVLDDYQARVLAVPAPEPVQLMGLVTLGEWAGGQLVDRCPHEAAEVIEHAAAIFKIMLAFVDAEPRNRKRRKQWR